MEQREWVAVGNDLETLQDDVAGAAATVDGGYRNLLPLVTQGAGVLARLIRAADLPRWDEERVLRDFVRAVRESRESSESMVVTEESKEELEEESKDQ